MVTEKRKQPIPSEITNLVLEAFSNYNDGWTQRGSIDKLIDIRDYLNGVIEEWNKEHSSDKG